MLDELLESPTGPHQTLAAIGVMMLGTLLVPGILGPSSTLGWLALVVAVPVLPAIVSWWPRHAAAPWAIFALEALVVTACSAMSLEPRGVQLALVGLAAGLATTRLMVAWTYDMELGHGVLLREDLASRPWWAGLNLGLASGLLGLESPAAWVPWLAAGLYGAGVYRLWTWRAQVSLRTAPAAMNHPPIFLAFGPRINAFDVVTALKPLTGAGAEFIVGDHAALLRACDEQSGRQISAVVFVSVYGPPDHDLLGAACELTGRPPFIVLAEGRFTGAVPVWLRALGGDVDETDTGGMRTSTVSAVGQMASGLLGFVPIGPAGCATRRFLARDAPPHIAARYARSLGGIEAGDAVRSTLWLLGDILEFTARATGTVAPGDKPEGLDIWWKLVAAGDPLVAALDREGPESTAHLESDVEELGLPRPEGTSWAAWMPIVLELRRRLFHTSIPTQHLDRLRIHLILHELVLSVVGTLRTRWRRGELVLASGEQELRPAGLMGLLEGGARRASGRPRGVYWKIRGGEAAVALGPWLALIDGPGSLPGDYRIARRADRRGRLASNYRLASQETARDPARAAEEGREGWLLRPKADGATIVVGPTALARRWRRALAPHFEETAVCDPRGELDCPYGAASALVVIPDDDAAEDLKDQLIALVSEPCVGLLLVSPERTEAGQRIAREPASGVMSLVRSLAANTSDIVTSTGAGGALAATFLQGAAEPARRIRGVPELWGLLERRRFMRAGPSALVWHFRSVYQATSDHERLWRLLGLWERTVQYAALCLGVLAGRTPPELPSLGHWVEWLSKLATHAPIARALLAEGTVGQVGVNLVQQVAAVSERPISAPHRWIDVIRAVAPLRNSLKPQDAAPSWTISSSDLEVALYHGWIFLTSVLDFLCVDNNDALLLGIVEGDGTVSGFYGVAGIIATGGRSVSSDVAGKAGDTVLFVKSGGAGRALPASPWFLLDRTRTDGLLDCRWYTTTREGAPVRPSFLSTESR